MFGKEKEKWKKAYLDEEFKNRRLMENIIDARMMLYTLFPDKIENISSIFQRYNLE